ncbi:MAG: DUF805 domain-containing protein [Bacteroidetes bacterium]|nr:DUF805 domain-containing protein [Bacteroidota bacterium]
MFKNIFSFAGRIRRTEFALSYIIYIGLYLVILYLGRTEPQAAFLYVGYIPLVWFLWAQGAKRCHDIGKSGWWQLIPFYFLWLLFQGGDKDKNEYREPPKSEFRYDPANYVDPFPLPDSKGQHLVEDQNHDH